MTSRPPLLTIGIPTYNRAPLLRAKLQQLLPLLGPDVAVLVVDNGSTDDTPAVIAEAARDGAPVSSFRNGANLGCDANYLRVLEMATGEWCWLQGDDEPVDLARFDELLGRLRAETADTVHLLAAGHRVDADAPSLFTDAEQFARRFYNLAAFQLMSCNLYRSAVARRYLIDGYRVAGLLHAYTAVGLQLMHRGAGLRVYDLGIMAASKPDPVAAGLPRWTNVDSHLGAWMTLHRVAPPEVRRIVDRREAGERARLLSANVLFDLLGARPAGLRQQHFDWMFELFPARYYGHITAMLAARALAALPDVSARLVELGARVVWGARAEARLRDLYGAGDGSGVRSRISEAIARRSARDERADRSAY